MAYQSPLNGYRISVRADANSAIDTGIVTLSDGLNTTLSQAGNTITIARPSLSYMVAAMTSTYSSNVSVDDHIQFETVRQSSGSSITLDTSTPYTTSSGAASKGRFTLAANRTYILQATLAVVDFAGDNNGIVTYSWTTSAGTALGTPGMAGTFEVDNTRAGNAFAIVPVGSSSQLVEVRIISHTGLYGIGESSGVDTAGAMIYTIP